MGRTIGWDTSQCDPTALAAKFEEVKTVARHADRNGLASERDYVQIGTDENGEYVSIGGMFIFTPVPEYGSGKWNALEFPQVAFACIAVLNELPGAAVDFEESTDDFGPGCVLASKALGRAVDPPEEDLWDDDIDYADEYV